MATRDQVAELEAAVKWVHATSVLYLAAALDSEEERLASYLSEKANRRLARARAACIGEGER